MTASPRRPIEPSALTLGFNVETLGRPQTLFEVGGIRCRELTADQLPMLQKFLEANPEYYFTVNGQPPGENEARDEFDFQLPSDWPYEKKWLAGFFRADGSMVGMADLVSHLFAEGVWHIGLFIVATSLHGSGAAAQLYSGLESWMRSRQGLWVRLGVVEGNRRAERFWERMGYTELRRRRGLQMGQKINDLRVMVKPIAEIPLAQYLDLVPRDRPGSP